MILDKICEERIKASNMGIVWEELVVSPNLFSLVKDDALSIIPLPSPINVTNVTTFMVYGMRVIVSKFIPDDEIIFQNKSGEFVRIKIGITRVVKKIVEEMVNYRRITLGEEDGC